MKHRLLSTLALAALALRRGRGRRVGRRRGPAVPVPRRAARRQLDVASRCRSRAATGPRCARCSARARTRRSRSAPSTEILIWRKGIPTVGTIADLKQGDWVTRQRARPRRLVAGRGRGATGRHRRRPRREAEPAAMPLWLYVGTVAGPQSGGHIALHVTAGNRRALRSLLGQSPTRRSPTSDDTIFLLWQGKVPTVIDASQLKAGDRITVRIRAPRRSTLAQVEATAGEPRRRPRAGQPGDPELAQTGGPPPAATRDGRSSIGRRGVQERSSARTRGRARARRRCPSGTYSATSRSFGEWICESGRPKPVITRRDALVGERGHDRQRPARSGSAPAGGRAPARTRRGRAGPPARRAARAPAPPTTRARPRASAPSGAASRRSRSTSGAISSTCWPGREPDRDVRDRLDRQHRLLQVRRAGRDPVHVERRLGERAHGRSPRPRRASFGRAPCSASSSAPVGQLRPARELLRGRRRDALAQRLDERAVVRDRARRASCISACAAFSAAPPYMPECRSRSPVRSVTWKYADAARREVEGRHVAADHAAVEDDRRVGAALVGLEELDDRVAAGLLLAVAAEADVDRQLAGLRELARGGEQHVELALVVDRAAAVEVVAADLGLERVRLPELERVGRLHVEVPVAEDRRRRRRRRSTRGSRRSRAAGRASRRARTRRRRRG